MKDKLYFRLIYGIVNSNIGLDAFGRRRVGLDREFKSYIQQMKRLIDVNRSAL